MWTRARWLLKAGPADYMLAMSVASASLPIIGKRLEPLGAATAMGIWGYRHMPDFLGATARSWLSPGNAELRKLERDSTNAVADAALVLGAELVEERELGGDRRVLVLEKRTPTGPRFPRKNGIPAKRPLCLR